MEDENYTDIFADFFFFFFFDVALLFSFLFADSSCP